MIGKSATAHFTLLSTFRRGIIPSIDKFVHTYLVINLYGAHSLHIQRCNMHMYLVLVLTVRKLSVGKFIGNGQNRDFMMYFLDGLPG